MFFKHALGHNWKDNGDETATCTRNGCGKKHTHEWDSGTITTEPTCTAPGEKTYHCTYEENGICKATKTEAVKKLGHKYILTKRDAPTCESDGVLYGKCSRCSKTITKQDAKNPALGHDWTDNGDGTATCGREGCGKNHTHDLDSGTTTVAPTCTTTGEKKYCCAYTNCPYKKTESLKATGHKNKETRNYKKPTCKYEGYTGDTYCKDCGTLLSSGKPTKKFDHDWNSGTVTKKATCKDTITEKNNTRMQPAQKMDIRFLFVRSVMIRKKKKLLQRVIPKELEIKQLQPARRKDRLEIPIAALVRPF